MVKKNTKAEFLSLGKSSETTSEASSFDFTDFFKSGQGGHVPLIPTDFLEWFIGFFEGDGSVYSYATLDKRDGRQGTSLQFSIAQKKKNIIEILQKTFGFGSLSLFQKDGEVYWRWFVSSQQDLTRIALLFSGN